MLDTCWFLKADTLIENYRKAYKPILVEQEAFYCPSRVLTPASEKVAISR